ncbi:MAG: prolyl oligopeptidase family serine peptidase [Acholeplasmataceae bacterium]|jgi:dipeptidyl aminopeptidase/acylaminoacyl peptidase|nr:prolyl oligopeptidase family serine peptidase [Acholeplasmataceae bacterium]
MKSLNRLEWVFADHKKRDILLILPGGGYYHTSKREGLPIAKKALEIGLHAVVFWYREERLGYPEVKDEGIHILEEIKSHPLVNRIFMIGFSAGGHYALMLSIARSDLIAKTILAYPVVSTNKSFYHGGSFFNLLGNLDNQQLLDELSLENHVHKDMGDVFIMHTADDQSVPVKNALILAEKLIEKNVAVELHIYPNGRHGASLGTKEVAFEDMDPILFEKEFQAISNWFELAQNFMKR